MCPGVEGEELPRPTDPEEGEDQANEGSFESVKKLDRLVREVRTFVSGLAIVSGTEETKEVLAALGTEARGTKVVAGWNELAGVLGVIG